MGLLLIHLEPIDKNVDTPPQLARKLYPTPDQNDLYKGVTPRAHSPASLDILVFV